MHAHQELLEMLRMSYVQGVSKESDPSELCFKKKWGVVETKGLLQTAKKRFEDFFGRIKFPISLSNFPVTAENWIFMSCHIFWSMCLDTFLVVYAIWRFN